MDTLFLSTLTYIHLLTYLSTLTFFSHVVVYTGDGSFWHLIRRKKEMTDANAKTEEKKYSLEDLQSMVKELKEELAILDTEEIKKEITEEALKFFSPDEIIGLKKKACMIEIKDLEGVIEEYKRILSG
ncbi:hypothetical protein MYX07_01335 [Patescibacteria group bacterium AH-259-L07]|nr:hypothetical protein [Patescibacteria group bacterium AH-259-L07]